MKIYRRILLFLVLICLTAIVTACMEPSTEEVRKKIKKELYDEYGEEFVVDRIGTRSSRGDEFYQARIYPKSIVGTVKEGDDYYYASATVEKLYLGRLGGVGDNYSYVKMNLGAEKYLMSKVKGLFGEKVLLKIDSELKVWGREEIIIKEYSNKEGTDAFIGYKELNFKKARQRVVKDQKHNRLFLDINIYVFNRIENKEEKKQRRKEIYQLIQYLKKENLFKYLELRVKFIDERVLADSYDKFENKIYQTKLIKNKVQGQKVEMPPLEFRKRMSKLLEKEIKKMSKKQLLNNIEKMHKDFLSDDGIGEYNEQYFVWISSIGMLKNDTRILFEEYKKKHNLEKHNYEKIKDIEMKKEPKYIYISKLN
mgnify:CR=1 FL=1